MTALIVCLLIAQEEHYLYVGRAPKDRDGFRDQKPQLEVHDIDHSHKLVKTIPLPSTVYNIRGICASAAARKLWIAHYGSYTRHDVGKILCLDLVSHKVLWEKSYAAAVDRGAVTPDGKKIFMPSGESVSTTYWYVIDGASGQEIDRIPHAGYTHNTIVTLDGRRAFLQAFGSRYVAVADTATHDILKRVGPFADTPRPLAINGRGTLLYQCVNDLLGFQVADVDSGKVLYTAKPPSAWPQPGDNGRVVSHGIALRADEKECWVVDQKHCGLHVFDVSAVPGGPPVWKKFIKTRSGSPEIFGQPGWIMSTIDGRYFYPETGEIIDTSTKEIVGQLRGADGKPTHSRFALEIVFRDGVPVRCGDQFGVGRATGNLKPAGRLTAPADGTTFTAPARITLTATASDPDGSVSKVEFYRGTTLLGVERYAPYGITWDNVAAGSYRLTARVTDNQGATTTTAPADVTVTAGLSVVSFTLINADTDQPVAGYNPMSAGATLNLGSLPTRRLNLRANTSPPVVGSVRFGYDADADYRVESGAPYALASNAGADYHAWTPAAGTHTVRATPFTGAGAAGGAGTARSITFSVVDGTVAARGVDPADNDLDGLPDTDDPDDDNDGTPDEADPDRDGDGADDAAELAAGTLIQDRSSHPEPLADDAAPRCGALGAEALLLLAFLRRRRSA